VACKECHAEDRYKNTLSTVTAATRKMISTKDRKARNATSATTSGHGRRPVDHNKSRFPLVGKHETTSARNVTRRPHSKMLQWTVYSCHKKTTSIKGVTERSARPAMPNATGRPSSSIMSYTPSTCCSATPSSQVRTCHKDSCTRTGLHRLLRLPQERRRA